METTDSAFPKNFLWGAATSAHQVEGNNHNSWSEWEKLGLVKNGEVSGRASGHYERFKEDFALAKELGHNAHRFSIEWSRVQPRPGFFDAEQIEHYRQVLLELKQLGLEPIVTLHHFTNPLWVEAYGGWTNRRVVDDFGRYVTTIIKELGSLATFWITINEPTVYTTSSYIVGYWPPQKVNYVLAWQAIRNMAEAHDLAYHIIHRSFPSAKVGVANNLGSFTAVRVANLLDQGLRVLSKYWHNDWWLNRTHDTQDFIGVNYYFRHPLKFRLVSPTRILEPQTDPGALKTDMGWEVYPQGLGQILDELKNYDRPIIITENGLADADDRLRAKYITDHVAQVAAAIGRGIDIRGYLYWSLIDNFEWREGFGARFGLVAVDYHTMKRTIRPSAYTFRQIAQRNGLS